MVTGSEQSIARRRVLRAAGAAAASVTGAVGVASGSGDAETNADGGRLEPITGDGVTPDDVSIAEDSRPATGIQPGAYTVTDNGGPCSVNFVWRDSDGGLYIGTSGGQLLEDSTASANAARAGENGEDVSDVSVAVDTDRTVTRPTGGGAEIKDVELVELGEVVYARRADPEDETGLGNDFGLVRVPEDLHEQIDPSVPVLGGPGGTTETTVPENGQIGAYSDATGSFVIGATRGLSGGETDAGDGTWEGNIGPVPVSGAPVLDLRGSVGGVDAPPAAAHITHTKSTSAPVVTVFNTRVAGTTVGRCKELVRQDIGLEIEVVEPGNL